MRAPGLSEAQRNAESLFESHTVVEIREVETKTKTDIEEKKKQLRQLVGGSYRDLISSADTILEMTRCCDGVLQNIKHIQSGFSKFQHTMSAAAAQEEVPVATQQRQILSALGSRVKYLVDTPELIWGCLDTREFLAAAQRLARASVVHECLMRSGQRATIERRFPLIGHLWPSVEKFRSQVLEQSLQWLRSEAALPCDAAAMALAAVASLEDLTSQKALKAFLGARREFLLSALQTTVATGLDSADAASARLAVIAAQVQEAICTVGELFLAAHKGYQRQALLPARARDEGMSAGEMLFDKLPGADSAPNEADAWQEESKAVIERLQPLDAEQTHTVCSHWLSQTAQGAQAAILQLLRGCRDAAELAAAESKLRAAIQHWKHTPQPESAVPQDILSPRAAPSATPTADSAATPFAAASALPDVGPALPEDWEGMCQWVMGGRVALWDELYEKAFLERGEELIAESFSAVAIRLRTPLEACIEAACHMEAAGPGRFQARAWPEEDALAPATPRQAESGRRRARRSTQQSNSGDTPLVAENGANRAPSWRAQVQELERTVSAELRSALVSAMLLLADQGQQGRPSSAMSGWDSRAYGGAGVRAGGRRQSRRGSALEPHIQQCCCKAASAIADDLQQRLEGLPAAQPAEASAHTVEQALLLARLAAAFGGPQSAFAAIAGPPERWREYLASKDTLTGAKQSSSRGKAQASSALMEPVQAKLRRVALAGHEHWATWAARALGAQLHSSMQQDPALSAHIPLRNWTETVVNHEDELGGPAEEMRFALPAAPSPPAQALLLAGVQEAARGGGCHLDTDALALLLWRLGEAVLSAYREVLQLGSPLDRAITEKGVLQLLFDARFLSNALAGGRPTAPEQAQPNGTQPQPGQHIGYSQAGAAGSAAQKQRKKAFTELERSLQERLDPIDWATYEPYVWANEVAVRPRMAVLYGLLTRLGHQGMEPVSRGAPPGEANVMAVAKQAARFKYLPISTPSVVSGGLRRAGGTPRAFGGGERSLEDYTFTGSAHSAEASLAEQAAQSAAASTFEALQTRISSQSQRLGVFGTLLGDKAAEVTAMAQQSFSDIALPSAFASALASERGSASGLLSSFKGSFQGASSGH